MKTTKRIISVITMLALLLATVGMAAVNAAAEDAVEYPNHFSALDYSYLESADGIELELAEANIDGGNVTGYHPINAETKEFVAGSIIYRSAVDFKDVQFQTAYSDNPWIGTATFEASADGENWITFETTREANGNHWAEAYSNVYDSVSFTEDQHIRYLKVTLVGNVVSNGPGMQNIFYSTYTPAEKTYANSATADNAISVKSEDGSSLAYSGNYGGHYFYGTKGTITFAANNYAPITDFNIKMFMHKSIGSTMTIETSVDGINFNTVSVPTEWIQDFSNVDWGCAYYDLTGSFNAAEEIRFVRVPISHTLAEANGLISFNYNAEAVDYQYANSIYVPSGTIYPEGSDELTFVQSIENGYQLRDASGNPKNGDVVYSIPEGISSYSINAVQLAPYGVLTYYASVDGSTWDQLTTTNTLVKAQAGGDSNLAVYAYSGMLLPGDGYKYLKINFYTDNNGSVPVVLSIKYSSAAQIVYENIEKEPVLKDSYENVKTASEATTKNSTGTLLPVEQTSYAGWTGCGEFFFFADADKNWKPGMLDYYSEDPITDYNIRLCWPLDSISVLASVDGENWIKLNPTYADIDPNNKQHPADGAWNVWQHNYFGVLEETANIHYIRIDMLWSSLAFPAIRTLSYNTRSVEDVFEEVYESEEITAADTEKLKEIAENADKLQLDNEEKAWLTRATLAAEYAEANGESVMLADVQLKYDGTYMSTVESAKQSFKYDVKIEDFLKGVLAALAENGAKDFYFGVHFVGRNATLAQMLTLKGNENYTSEEPIKDISAAGNFPIEILRSNNAELGQRVTVLPYVRWTDANGEAVYLYADSVIAKSPIGWLKQAVGEVKNGTSTLADAYVARIEAMKTDYAEISDLDALFTGIAATANQTEALNVLSSYKADADVNYYYQIMLDLFSFTR